jgi:hypothetical protein
VLVSSPSRSSMTNWFVRALRVTFTNRPALGLPW